MSFHRASTRTNTLYYEYDDERHNIHLTASSPGHTHTFNGPFSGTAVVSQYQRSKTNLDFTEARDSEWQWHQLGHMQVCTSLQTDNHASTPPLSFFTARCYVSAVLAVALCPSVCPSQVGVLLKRLNVGSHKQHHTIPQRL